MSTNAPIDDADLARCAAELYDVSDDYVNDIAFIRELMAGKGIRRVLEPFSGTGRIMIPLLEAGCEVHGLDYDPAMIERARSKSHLSLRSDDRGRA